MCVCVCVCMCSGVCKGLRLHLCKGKTPPCPPTNRLSPRLPPPPSARTAICPDLFFSHREHVVYFRRQGQTTSFNSSCQESRLRLILFSSFLFLSDHTPPPFLHSISYAEGSRGTPTSFLRTSTTCAPSRDFSTPKQVSIGSTRGEVCRETSARKLLPTINIFS